MTLYSVEFQRQSKTTVIHGGYPHNERAALHMRRTWEVDSGVNGALVATEPCTRCGYFRRNQAARDPGRSLQRNPLAIGQAPRLCGNRAEVSEIGQCLPTAEETQIHLSAQVPETTKHNTQ